MNSHESYTLSGIKSPLVWIAAMIWTLLMCTHVQAHKVNLFAYVEGDRIIVEGYFSAKSKAQNCAVEVFDEGGKKIGEGKTDQNGIYSFRLADLPAFSGGLKIVLEAGMGHKSDYTLSASDLPGSLTKDAPLKASSPEEKTDEALASSAAGTSQVVDQAALTEALEKVIDKKLDPIVKMLGKQEKLLLEEKHGGPRLNDIIGGIGWIVGMVGLAAFFWGRNRSFQD